MSQKSRKPNALKHGATSRIVLLWGEKQEDYDDLTAKLYLEWYPDGPTEEGLVDQLRYWLWRRRRLVRRGEIAAQEKLRVIRHNNNVADVVDNLRPWAAHFEKATSQEQVEELLSQIPSNAPAIRKNWPLVDKEDPSSWGPKIAKGIASLKVERHSQAEEFMVLTDPRGFEEAMDRQERIDAKVEQIIKRLVQLKAMKQIQRRLEPKLIDVTAARPVLKDHGEPDGPTKSR